MEIQNSKDWAKVYRACGFIEKGVCEYADERVYLSEETLIKSLHTIKGRPVIIDHMTGITPENMNEHAVGYVVDYEVQGACDCKFVIFDDEGKKVITDGYSVSCAYKPKSFGPGGTWHNVPYDREITDLEYTHLALVQNPRYEDAKVYENAKDDDGKGRWITVKGTHVFVKDGQSVEDAMKDTFKSSPTEKREKGGKQKKEDSLEGKYKGKDKYDPNELLKDIKKVKEEGHVDDVMDFLGIEEAEEGTAFLGAELEGKYMREDAEFDEEQIKKDIEKAKSLGHKGIDNISEFLGLDPDEYMEITGESYLDEDEDEDEGEGVSDLFDTKYKAKIQEAKQRWDDAQKKIEDLNTKLQKTQDVKKGDKILKQMEKFVEARTKAGEDESKLYGEWYKEEFGNKEKHNNKEDEMKVEEFFNKMGEMIEEKLNACKGKMNEGEDEEVDDDDKFEMDGETYSKKELVNAWKEKKNAEESEEKSKEKSEEESEEKSNEGEEEDEEKEKQNSGDEFFNAMEKRMQQQAFASDKIEVYSQAKGLEKGRSIYTK